MTKVTDKQVIKATKDLALFTKIAKRKLFEYETIMSAYEIKNGKADVFQSARELIKKAH